MRMGVDVAVSICLACSEELMPAMLACSLMACLRLRTNRLPHVSCTQLIMRLVCSLQLLSRVSPCSLHCAPIEASSPITTCVALRAGYPDRGQPGYSIAGPVGRESAGGRGGGGGMGWGADDYAAGGRGASG